MNTRFGEVQDWPPERSLIATRSSDTLSKLQSANTIYGAFPPNSSESFLNELADFSYNNFPTLVEPVNDYLRILKSLQIISPNNLASLVTTFKTPAGKPASSSSIA